MTGINQLRLSQCHVRAIVEHARGEAPNEACGLVAGKDGQVERVYALTNADHSPTTYRLDPGEQYHALVEIEGYDWEAVGTYHSHTHSLAYPSPTDIRQAHDPDAIYLILSVGDADRPVLRGFHIAEGRVTEIELDITDKEEV
jgi:proteasome lid subunit RPN8/RPN11